MNPNHWITRQLHAEKQLAIALGWTNLVDVGGSLLGTPPGGAENSRGQAAVPRWTRDWSACGPLMVALDCYPEYGGFNQMLVMGPDFHTGPTIVAITQHQSKEHAAMFAVVQAAILKLAGAAL